MCAYDVVYACVCVLRVCVWCVVCVCVCVVGVCMCGVCGGCVHVWHVCVCVCMLCVCAGKAILHKCFLNVCPSATCKDSGQGSQVPACLTWEGDHCDSEKGEEGPVAR